MVILGLGSNKGDRLRHLQQTVSVLSHIMENIKCSPVYESDALLPAEAPREWDIDFLNMAVCGETELLPRELLSAVKKIEKDLGRTATGHWGPREIDIDILAFGNVVIEEKELVIPHRYLLVRDFALVPLADIAPDWAYPAEGDFYRMKARALAGNLVSGLRNTDIVI
jgi:2-amino-4-hydroxy-6-hydroxymethyldihydropteridine diphosphokinase